MSDKKYSVFISSTFDDLKDERMAVLRAILQHGHFPLGMELWGAADEQQWQIIQRQIDVADYYVVIVAHRYGSLSETGVSWTEREYDYAVEKGVPVLGFVQKGGSWPTEFVDKGENAERLEQFRTKVQTKPVSFWSNADQLMTEVVLALGRQIQSTSRVGWVRASDALTSTISHELARLSEENAALRAQIEKNQSEQILPDLAIDVVSAQLRILPSSDRSVISIDSTIELFATLRKGKPVGLMDHNITARLDTETQGLDLKVSLNRMHPLVIDSPIAFYMNCYETIQASEFRHQRIAIGVVVNPIGFAVKCSVEIEFKPKIDTSPEGFGEWDMTSSRVLHES